MTAVWTRRPGRARAGLGCALLLCLSVASLGAQATTAAPTKRSFWYLVLGAEQGWDSNPTLNPGASSDLITTAGATLSAFKKRQLSTYTISANAGVNRFEKNTGFNNFSYGLSVSADKRLTAALTTAAQVSFDTRFSPNAVAVGAVDLPVLRFAQQRQLASNVSLTNKLTARTSLSGRVGYSQAWFDAPGVVPGYQLTGTAEVTHVISPTNGFLIDLNAQQGAIQNATTSIQSLTGGWRKIFGQLSLVGSGGVVRASTQGVTTYGPTGTVSLADSLGPGYLTGGYSYTVSPAFGLGGVFTTSAFFASYDLQALRGNFLTISTVSGRSEQNGVPGPALRAESGSVRLRRVLKSGLTLSFASSYRARRDFFLTKGFGASLGLGFTFGT